MCFIPSDTWYIDVHRNHGNHCIKHILRADDRSKMSLLFKLHLESPWEMRQISTNILVLALKLTWFKMCFSFGVFVQFFTQQHKQIWSKKTTTPRNEQNKSKSLKLKQVNSFLHHWIWMHGQWTWTCFRSTESVQLCIRAWRAALKIRQIILFIRRMTDFKILVIRSKF